MSHERCGREGHRLRAPSDMLQDHHGDGRCRFPMLPSFAACIDAICKSRQSLTCVSRCYSSGVWQVVITLWDALIRHIRRLHVL